MTDPKPLQCPFCAAAPILVEDHLGWHEVRCDNDSCGVVLETLSYETRAEAINVWNTRPGAFA